MAPSILFKRNVVMDDPIQLCGGADRPGSAAVARSSMMKVKAPPPSPEPCRWSDLRPFSFIRLWSAAGLPFLPELRHGPEGQRSGGGKLLHLQTLHPQEDRTEVRRQDRQQEVGLNADPRIRRSCRRYRTEMQVTCWM